MGLLSLLWGGDNTGADSPDWLVGNDNFAPVINLLADGFELSCIDSISLTSFTLIKLFTNAGHDTDPGQGQP